MAKKKILVFTSYYLPGYKAGGPIRTISNMVKALGDKFEFYIVTSDRDAFESKPYPGVERNKSWRMVGSANVMYLSPDNRSFGSLRKIIKETPHDFLYLNSYFDYGFSIKVLILRRLRLIPRRVAVLAPRGEFSEGALELKKNKKALFRSISNLLGLHKGIRWHASSGYEKSDILRVQPKANVKDIRVAVNLPDLSSIYKELDFTSREPGAPLRVVFLSRVNQKKNLDFVIEVLRFSGVRADLDVFGLIDDEVYYKKCEEIANTVPNLYFRYMGTVSHSDVITTLSRYDLFFLPTKGENYGHVILESLTAGTPALISNTTPWKDFDEQGVGWVVPLENKASFAEKIRFMANMRPDAQLIMRGKSSQYARAHLLRLDSIESNYKVFLE